jgi:hypothetical protein
MTRLLAADGAAGDQFGTSVSISKDASTIVVGAEGDDFNTRRTDIGAAYIFRITNTTTTTTSAEWTQVGKFNASERENGNFLGFSVAIKNSIVAVSAPFDISYPGSVYILDSAMTASTAEPTDTTEPNIIPTPNPSIRPLRWYLVLAMATLIIHHQYQRQIQTHPQYSASHQPPCNPFPTPIHQPIIIFSRCNQNQQSNPRVIQDVPQLPV